MNKKTKFTILEKKEVFMTWDNWCLKKLKEIGKSTLREWSDAMGNKHSNAFDTIIKNNIEKLTITTPGSGKRPKFYEVKEELK